MRIYFIGAGVIARTHAEASARVGEPVELRVADPSPAALAGFLQAFPDATAFVSAAEMLASEPARDDDIVIVATPPFAHAEPALAALASGRNVLCEKPLAMTTGEADEMLEVSENHGRLLGCCSTRFSGLPHTEAVKQALRSGVLGEVYHVSFINRWSRSRSGIEYQPDSRWFLDSSLSGGGVLMDWGPYDISTLDDIFTPDRVEISDAWISRIQTAADPAGVPFDVETQVGASMVFGAGDRSIRVTYERASASHLGDRAHAEIEGTLGALRWTPFDSHAPVFLRRDVDGVDVEEILPPAQRAPYTIFDHPLVFFADAVRGSSSRATVGDVAVGEFRWLRAVYDCARTGEVQRIELRR
jgi:predicted dehydrogenase